MTSQPRPVWLTDHDMDWLMAAVTHLRMDEHTHVADIVESIVQRARAAPADAVAAARSALTDCEHRSPGMRSAAEPIGDLYNAEGCRIVRGNAVLRALGYPHTEQA